MFLWTMPYNLFAYSAGYRGPHFIQTICFITFLKIKVSNSLFNPALYPVYSPDKTSEACFPAIRAEKKSDLPMCKQRFLMCGKEGSMCPM